MTTVLLVLLALAVGYLLGTRPVRPGAHLKLRLGPVRRITMDLTTQLENDEEGLFAPQVVDDDGDETPFDGPIAYNVVAGAETLTLVPPTEADTTQYGVDGNARWFRANGPIGGADVSVVADGKVGDGEILLVMNVHVDFTGPQAAEVKGTFVATRKIAPPA